MLWSILTPMIEPPSNTRDKISSHPLPLHHNLQLEVRSRVFIPGYTSSSENAEAGIRRPLETVEK